jgi:hypothetical protein
MFECGATTQPILDQEESGPQLSRQIRMPAQAVMSPQVLVGTAIVAARKTERQDHT